MVSSHRPTVHKIKAPLLLLTNHDSSNGFSVVQNKKKLSRANVDFTAVFTKQQPQPLNGIANTNFFRALQSMNVAFVVKHATADKRRDAARASRSYRIKKAAKATPILEVTESMINDENTALLDTLPNKFDEADRAVLSMSAAACPLAFKRALSFAMAGNGRLIGDLALLHLINRMMSATYPNEDTTFLANQELSRASKVLGIFELALMSIAPKLFENYHWNQYLTPQPVEWIPANHSSFLHPNTLLFLLRSDSSCSACSSGEKYTGRIICLMTWRRCASSMAASRSSHRF
ncbi:hypothetical protein Plhal710r2_c058g0167631 [Plasmopara halstedii]